MRQQVQGVAYSRGASLRPTTTGTDAENLEICIQLFRNNARSRIIFTKCETSVRNIRNKEQNPTESRSTSRRRLLKDAYLPFAALSMRRCSMCEAAEADANATRYSATIMLTTSTLKLKTLTRCAAMLRRSTLFGTVARRISQSGVRIWGRFSWVALAELTRHVRKRPVPRYSSPEHMVCYPESTKAHRCCSWLYSRLRFKSAEAFCRIALRAHVGNYRSARKIGCKVDSGLRFAAVGWMFMAVAACRKILRSRRKYLLLRTADDAHRIERAPVLPTAMCEHPYRLTSSTPTNSI